MRLPSPGWIPAQNRRMSTSQTRRTAARACTLVASSAVISVTLALQPRDGSPVLIETLRHAAAAQIGLLAELVDILAAARPEPIESLGISDALSA